MTRGLHRVSPRVTGYGACGRCAHGTADGRTCAHRGLVRAGVGTAVPTSHARATARLCGPDAHWHEYRAGGADAPPLL
jgi:hypothetical protein